MVYSKIIETNKINLSEASYGLYILTDQKTTNIEEGLNYIMKAMKEESPNAYYAYGFALVRGIGVPKDPKQGSQYFTKSAENGCPNGMYLYGISPLDDVYGLVNKQEGHKNLKKVADKGSIEARSR